MVTRPIPCDPGRLRLLLEDRLPEEDQDALSEHLEGCESCRDALERMAAETRWWSDVKELAAPEPAVDGRPQPAGPATEIDSTGNDPVTIPTGFLSPIDDPECLGKIGCYEVSEIIGRGGNGLVLKALDPALRRLVAIKVLAPELATSAAARRRFAREARAAAAVTHEHVVAIHAVDTAPNGLPYLVMTYVPGKSLQERLDRSGPLEVREILRIGMQTASGLAAAHAQGLVHRDIKPANILLEDGMERVKITDFGLARAADDASLSQSGVVAGTPQYMAPEQARGEIVDHRADLFSLGSVMYTMATGRPPFRADSTLAVLRRVSDDPPRPIRDINPEIPEWLVDIIARLHEKDSAKRFQSATEVAELLGRCLAFVQNPTDRVPPYRREPGTTVVTLRRWALPVAALLVVGLGLGAAEATGVTHFVSTVLRVKNEESTLIVDVREPGVQVEIDGQEVVLKELGQHEIRLNPGPHSLRAVKDGTLIRNEPITVARGGREIVRIEHEPREPRLKSQAEYVDSLAGKSAATLRTDDTVSAIDPREVDRLRSHAKDLEDKIRRQQKRLEQYEHGASPVPRVSVADGAPQPATAPAATFESQPQGPDGLTSPTMMTGSVGNSLAPQVSERKAPAPKLNTTVATLGEPVAALEVSADGQTLVAASGRLVRVWDLRASEVAPRVLEGHSGNVTAIAVAAHASLAASGGADGTVRFWDLAEGKGTETIDNLGGAVRSLAFSPDGDVLAIALDGGRVRLVRARSGEFVQELPKQSQPVVAVRFSPDGKLLATAGGADKDLTQPGVVTLWNLATGAAEATLGGHRYMVRAIAFSPDGRKLVTGDAPPRGSKGAQVYLWDVASREQIQAHYVNVGVQAVAFSTDGDTLAATTQSGRMYVYQLSENQAPMMSWLEAHAGAAPGLAFGSEGETLITGGKDGAIKIWTLTTVNVARPLRQAISLAEPLATFHDGMGPRIWSARFSPDGKSLAASYSVNVTDDDPFRDGRGGLALWDPAAGNLRDTVLTDHVIRDLAFAPNSETLATAEFDRAVNLRSATDGHVLKTFPVSTQGTNAVSFSRDARWLAAAGLDGLVYVWDVETTHEAARLKEHDGPVYTVAFSPDGKTVASAGADMDILLWNLSTGKVERTLEGHENAVEQVAFAPDGKSLASASHDQTIKLWRVATGKEIRTLNGHQLPALGLAFSKDGEYLATCAGTWGVQAGPGVGELILWDLKHRRALTPPLAYPNRLLGLSFSPNPKTFATAGWDGTVKLWNVDTLATNRAGTAPTAPAALPGPQPLAR